MGCRPELEQRGRQEERREVVHAHHTEVIASRSELLSQHCHGHPTFACSVASLCRSAGFHAPGLPSLRRGALAHRGLARGSSSVQFTRHVWVYTHSHPHFTLYSRVAVQEPTSSYLICYCISVLRWCRQRCRQPIHTALPLSVVCKLSASKV